MNLAAGLHKTSSRAGDLHTSGCVETEENILAKMRPLLKEAEYTMNWLSNHESDISLAKKKLADHQGNLARLDFKQKLDVLCLISKSGVFEQAKADTAQALAPLFLQFKACTAHAS